MKDFVKQNTILVTVLGLVIAAVVYYFFWAEPSTAPAPRQDVGAQVIQRLEEFRSLDLSSDVFERPAYRSLVDHRVEIEPQPYGRENPFAGATSR